MTETDILRQAITAAFEDLSVPAKEDLICHDGPADPAGESMIRNTLAGTRWPELTTEFLKSHWAAFCYLSPGAYRYYLPAILSRTLDDFTESGPLTHTTLFMLVPSFWELYFNSDDAELRRRQSVFTPRQYEVVCQFLGLALESIPCLRPLAAQALRWGWNNPPTPALSQALRYYQRLHSAMPIQIDDPAVASLVAEIRSSFAETPYPGDLSLCGSEQGDEPAEYAMEFRGLTWQQLHPTFLKQNYGALSFLSHSGFRYFLPAFLISDLTDDQCSADPVFHLTHGIKPEDRDEWLEYSQERLAGFSRPERRAIIHYLQYKLSNGCDAQAIQIALEEYWQRTVE